jgi:hypothetical protein
MDKRESHFPKAPVPAPLPLPASLGWLANLWPR